MAKPFEYQISIQQITMDGDRYFCAKVREFPDLADFGETYSDAYDAAIESIRALQETYAERGVPFPEPSPAESEEYSGRVTLRLGKTLHRQAAIAAAADDLSLNQWIVRAVSYAVGALEGVEAFNKFAGYEMPVQRVNIIPVYAARSGPFNSVLGQSLTVARDLVQKVAVESTDVSTSNIIFRDLKDLTA